MEEELDLDLDDDLNITSGNADSDDIFEIDRLKTALPPKALVMMNSRQRMRTKAQDQPEAAREVPDELQ